MNGRIDHDATPEGRIAAVAKSLGIQMAESRRKTGKGPSEPDYADFRDVLRPFIQRELLLARIDEARKISGRALTERVKELARQLADLQMPDGFDL
jgi:hypothetical protein